MACGPIQVLQAIFVGNAKGKRFPRLVYITFSVARRAREL